MVHEVQELDASAPPIVVGDHHTGGDVEGGKQRGRAMSLVFMRLPLQRPAIRHLQIPLGSLQCLDAGLLIDRQHHRMIRRAQIEPDDLGRLGDKVGVCAEAPRLRRRKVDPLGAQEAPNILVGDIAERRRQERCSPAAVTGWRRLIELCQNAPACGLVVDRLRARSGLVLKTCQPIRPKADPPFASCPDRATEFSVDRPRRQATRRKQNDPGALHKPSFRLRRSNQAFKHGSLRIRQFDRRRFLDVHHILESRLNLSR